MLTAASQRDDEFVAPAGKWKRRHDQRLGSDGFLKTLETLLEDGLVTLEWSATRARQGQLKFAAWPEKQFDALSSHLGVQSNEEEGDDGVETLSEALRRFNPEPPLGPLCAFWEDQLAALKNGDVAVIQDRQGQELLTSRSKRYHLILRATVALAAQSMEHETISFDELSIQVTGNTKQLRTERPLLRAILEEPFQNFGVREHEEFVQWHGPLVVKSQDMHLATGPFIVGMPASSIEHAVFSTGAKRAVVIENPTTFEFAVHRGMFRGNIILLANGRPTKSVQEFLLRIVKVGVAEVIVWCDLDPVGIMIAESLRSLLDGKAKWVPFLMDTATFARAPVRRQLTGQNLRYAERLSVQEGTWFSDLGREITSSGQWVEQETLHQLAVHTLADPFTVGLQD